MASALVIVCVCGRRAAAAADVVLVALPGLVLARGVAWQRGWLRRVRMQSRGQKVGLAVRHLLPLSKNNVVIRFMQRNDIRP